MTTEVRTKDLLLKLVESLNTSGLISLERNSVLRDAHLMLKYEPEPEVVPLAAETPEVLPTAVPRAAKATRPILRIDEDYKR